MNEREKKNVLRDSQVQETNPTRVRTSNDGSELKVIPITDCARAHFIIGFNSFHFLLFAFYEFNFFSVPQ